MYYQVSRFPTCVLVSSLELYQIIIILAISVLCWRAIPNVHLAVLLGTCLDFSRLISNVLCSLLVPNVCFSVLFGTMSNHNGLAISVLCWWVVPNVREKSTLGTLGSD